MFAVKGRDKKPKLGKANGGLKVACAEASRELRSGGKDPAK